MREIVDAILRDLVLLNEARVQFGQTRFKAIKNFGPERIELCIQAILGYGIDGRGSGGRRKGTGLLQGAFDLRAGVASGTLGIFV